jgi:hypothetical protein
MKKKIITVIFLVLTILSLLKDANAQSSYIGKTIYDDQDQKKEIDTEKKKEEKPSNSKAQIVFKYGYGVLNNISINSNEFGLIKNSDGFLMGFSLSNTNSGSLKTSGYGFNLGYQIDSSKFTNSPYAILKFGLMNTKDQVKVVETKGINLGIDVGMELLRVNNIASIAGIKINNSLNEGTINQAVTERSVYLGLAISF